MRAGLSFALQKGASYRMSISRAAQVALLGAVLVCALPLAGTAAAQDQQDGKALLTAFTTYLAGLDSFRVTYSCKTVDEPGAEQSTTVKGSLSVRKPAFYRFQCKADEGEWIEVNGEGGYIAIDVKGAKYATRDAADSLDGIMELTGSTGATYGAPDPCFLNMMVTVPNLDFLKSEPDGEVNAKLLGVEDVGGKQCRRVAVTLSEGVELHLWLDVGRAPLACKASLLFDASQLPPGLPGVPEGGGMMEAFSYTDMVWQIPGEFATDEFTATPPEGAEQVDSFMPEQPAQLQTGIPAPEFDIVTLDGDKTPLTDLLGEKIIVLDFWATWCGPCREALPILIKVTGEFKDENIVFFAVNQQEDADTIGAFLEKEGLKPTVAMDPEGKIGEAYGVTGIPQSVIIGMDGRVQVVHVGFTAGFEEQLRKNLEDLVAGKDLSAEPQPAGGGG